jgi:hypothetical protein
LTTLPFAAADEKHLIAPRKTFVEQWAPPSGGRGLNLAHSARASLALETAHQVARRIPGIVLKGGTPLQARVSWPPVRASIDVDLEWPDTTQVIEALVQWTDTLKASGVSVDTPESREFATVAIVRFPREDGETTVRVEVGEPGSSTQLSEKWANAPPPWNGSADLRVPTLAAQAAQKLLLAAPPPFGRDRDHHIGRQSLCKDLFDLYVLGQMDLTSAGVQQAAITEIRIKGGRIKWESPTTRVLEGAKDCWLRFAGPRADKPDTNKPLWEAFSKVRSTIAAPFGDGDLRIAAGCARHSVETLSQSSLDWTDAWTPRRSGGARKAWQGKSPIVPVTDVSDEFQGQRGLLEAWAKAAP